MRSNFIKKPLLTIFILLLIISAIIYLQSGKQKAIVPSKTESAQPKYQENLSNDTSVIAKSSKYQKAPDFVGIEKWINSESISISNLKGKVVLVDFWTYSCINCIRTLPYLRTWHEKYKNSGFVIVGVHTPEFEFEKKYENVIGAVKMYKIEYPVAQDNDYVTWRAYKNRFWPRKYLVDADGYIRYDHVGEGAYEETEKVIQELLAEKSSLKDKEKMLSVNISKPKEAVDVDFSRIRTPEIYFGYKFFSNQLGNKEGYNPGGSRKYVLPKSREYNIFYLDGEWKTNVDNMELLSDSGKIVLRYYAKSINLVTGSSNENRLNIKIDGKEVNPVIVKDFKLYNLFTSDSYLQHEIEITASKGFMAYSFTFG